MSEFDDWEEQTPEQIKKREIESFVERQKSNGRWGSQYQPILNAVIDKAVKKVEGDDGNFENLESLLWDAEEVVDDITSALKMWWRDPQEGRFWYGFADDYLIDRPKEWMECSPIDQQSLDAAVARYFKNPWLQCNELEWYILTGFVTDELLRFADGVRSGAAFGEFNLAWAFSGGSFIKMMILKPVIAFIGFTVRWVLLPGTAAGLAYLGYETAAYWVLGAFAVLVLFRLIFLPKNIMRWRERKKVKAKVERMYGDVVQIRNMTANSTLNPTQIKNRIVEAEKEFTLFKPAVHSILDRMIERDPAVFTTNL